VSLVRIRSVALLLSVSWIFAACAVNPVTGERELSLLSKEQEIQLGNESDPAIVAQYGVVEDEAIVDYVQDIGQRMVPVSHRPDLPYTFRVLDDPVVNAFALPGGYVYITRGILAYLDSEAALAGVVGHEIGHITARHGVQRYTQQTLLGAGLGLGSVLSETFAQYADIAGQAAQLLLLKYGRDDERQSDVADRPPPHGDSVPGAFESGESSSDGAASDGASSDGVPSDGVSPAASSSPSALVVREAATGGAPRRRAS